VQEAQVRRPRLAVAAAALVVGAVLAQAVTAQQLNQRKSAPPAAESKKSRMLARAELQAQEDGSSLKSEELTVTKSCGNVQIGGAPTADPGKRTLVGSQPSLRDRDNGTVVTNVVNICR
jgi:serine protease inhibitor ecotin